MQLPRKYLLALSGLLAVIVAPSAHGVTVTKSRTENVNSSQLESPYFTESADGAVTPTPTTPNGTSSGVWAPATATKAGAVTSTSPRGVIAIAGTGTALGLDGIAGTSDDWINGNGIPTGLTLNFTAQFTISAGPNAPAGSLLTFTGNLGNPPNNDFGNGLGMTQASAGVSQFDVNEELSFSAFTISGVGFTGTAPAGYSIANPSVSTLSTKSFRSAGFNPTGTTTEMAVLTSGADTVTFGPMAPAGTIASNITIGNNFNGTFTPQPGPYTLAMTAGAMGLKGIGFAYDISFDFNPIVNADFNSDTLVDGADFLIWQQNFALATGATRAQGNANPGVDGAVDGTDLGIWSSQFGSTQPLSAVAVSAVPEPGALLLALGASIAVGVRCRVSRTTR